LALVRTREDFDRQLAKLAIAVFDPSQSSDDVVIVLTDVHPSILEAAGTAPAGSTSIGPNRPRKSSQKPHVRFWRRVWRHVAALPHGTIRESAAGTHSHVIGSFVSSSPSTWTQAASLPRAAAPRTSKHVTPGSPATFPRSLHERGGQSSRARPSRRGTDPGNHSPCRPGRDADAAGVVSRVSEAGKRGFVSRPPTSTTNRHSSNRTKFLFRGVSDGTPPSMADV